VTRVWVRRPKQARLFCQPLWQALPSVSCLRIAASIVLWGWSQICNNFRFQDSRVQGPCHIPNPPCSLKQQINTQPYIYVYISTYTYIYILSYRTDFSHKTLRRALGDEPCDGTLLRTLRRRPCDGGASAARALRQTLRQRHCDALPRAKLP
jgi:hypothetical protein